MKDKNLGRTCSITLKAEAIASVIVLYREITLAAFGSAAHSYMIGVIDDHCRF